MLLHSNTVVSSSSPIFFFFYFIFPKYMFIPKMYIEKGKRPTNILLNNETIYWSIATGEFDWDWH